MPAAAPTADPPGGRAQPEHRHPREVPLQGALAALADPVRLTLVRELA
jgi:hypothetical protein